MKNSRHVMFGLLMQLLAGKAFGNIDSLKALLNNSMHDTGRCSILYQLAEEETDDVLWVMYNHQLKKLAGENLVKNPPNALRYIYLKYLAASENNTGVIFYDKGDMQKALIQYQIALKIRKEIKDDKGIAETYNNIGAIYYNKGDLLKALEYYNNSLKIRVAISDQRGQATAIYSIALIHFNLKDINFSLEYFQKALHIQKSIDDDQGMTYSLNKIGQCYQALGNDSMALNYFQESLILCERIGADQGVATALTNKGTIFREQGNLELALDQFNKSLKISRETNSKKAIAIALKNIADVLNKQNERAAAQKYAAQSLSLAEELGFPDIIRDCSYLLMEIYEYQNQSADALKMYKKYIQMKDSINIVDTKNEILKSRLQLEYQIKELATKSEQEKKDAIALKELQRQKIVSNSFIGGFSMMLVFAGIFFYQRNKIKKGKMLSDSLLLNILPINIAEELKTNKTVKAKLFEQVTVIFTDFKDFTVIAKSLPPDQIVAAINEYYSAFDIIMRNNNIEKIKTIGDSYMAASGLTPISRNHTCDAVKAALEIQDFVKMTELEKIKTGDTYFRLRIGVHTGPVVAGVVGINKFQYDIWGDTVNIASRLESAGETGNVNISNATYELVRDRFACKYRGKVKVKNGGEIDMYFVECIL